MQRTSDYRQDMSNFQTSPQRHANMAAIHGKDTKPEMVVRRYLWGHGFRYRLNHPRLPGKPSYHFYVQDHKGNNRLVLSVSGGVEEVNSYYPYGGLMSMSTASTQIWDQLNVFVKGIRNKLFAKNEKINICFFISSIHHSILL